MTRPLRHQTPPHNLQAALTPHLRHHRPTLPPRVEEVRPLLPPLRQIRLLQAVEVEGVRLPRQAVARVAVERLLLQAVVEVARLLRQVELVEVGRRLPHPGVVGEREPLRRVMAEEERRLRQLVEVAGAVAELVGQEERRQPAEGPPFTTRQPSTRMAVGAAAAEEGTAVGAGAPPQSSPAFSTSGPLGSPLARACATGRASAGQS